MSQYLELLRYNKNAQYELSCLVVWVHLHVMLPFFQRSNNYSDFLVATLIEVAHPTTLKCLSIGTPNTTTFPFVPNGKWLLLGVPIIEHILIWM